MASFKIYSQSLMTNIKSRLTLIEEKVSQNPDPPIQPSNPNIDRQIKAFAIVSQAA